uniref:SpaA isopeptide-forming pilin-related protein n=1 Tax=Thomasclavelia cocleata TaxID=69824 RepID=UPI00242C815B
RGRLTFKELEVGIYLLRVTDYNEYEFIEPTLISVPTYNVESQNSMNFDVTVIPKHTPFKVSVSKQDITDHKELEGAHLQVTDKDGKVVDKWVSVKEPHMIQDLYCGQTYTLTETIAPDGYKIAKSINFIVDETGEVQKVVMYDELLSTSGGKTGDDNNIYATALITLLSGLGILVSGLYMYRRKKYN